MTTLLCRLFLRGRDPSTPTGRRAYGTMAGAVGIALNLLLAAGKFIVGVLSGALSVQADAVNNLSDAGSQIISLVSFRIAARPADRASKWRRSPPTGSIPSGTRALSTSRP